MYSVVWEKAAETSVLEALLRAADKPSLWAIVQSIDAQLRLNPIEAGESRDGNTRIVFIRPFCVLYTYDESERKVYIEQLKWVGQ